MKEPFPILAPVVEEMDRRLYSGDTDGAVPCWGTRQWMHEQRDPSCWSSSLSRTTFQSVESSGSPISLPQLRSTGLERSGGGEGGGQVELVPAKEVDEDHGERERH